MSIPTRSDSSPIELAKKYLPYLALLGIGTRGLSLIRKGKKSIPTLLRTVLSETKPSLVESVGESESKSPIVQPFSANVRAVQPKKTGSYVLFSNGQIYKYAPQMTPLILATLGKPFSAKTTGRNVFKAWFKGLPSIGGSFYKMISKNPTSGTYKKVYTAPKEILQAKMEDKAFKGASKRLNKGK